MANKTFIIGHLPDGLEKTFIQYIRDFDVAHPGCYFDIVIEAPNKSVIEAIEMLRVDPDFTFVRVLKR